MHDISYQVIAISNNIHLKKLFCFFFFFGAQMKKNHCEENKKPSSQVSNLEYVHEVFLIKTLEIEFKESNPWLA
jgi:hypothetical protein